MSKDQNKELISKTQALLKLKGYDVKTSHLYEVFAQLSGYKNWHVAASKNANLAENIKKYVSETPFPKEETFSSYVNRFFLDEDDNTVELKLFDPTMASWNYSISGETGSGKSVLVNKLLAQLVINYDSPMIYIFDYDGEISYPRFTQLNQGQIISFNVNKTLPKIQVLELNPKSSFPTEHKIKKIRDYLIEKYQLKSDPAEIEKILRSYYYDFATQNPKTSKEILELFNQTFKSLIGQEISWNNDLFNFLELKEGECLPSVRNLQTMMNTLEVMLSSNPKDIDGFKLFDKSAILELIKKTYESVGQREGRYPKISDLIKESVLDQKLGENFRTKLSFWTIGGKYPLFEETTIDLSSDIILANFKGLEGDPLLRRIYILQLQERLMDKMYASPNRVKVVVREGMVEVLKDLMLRQAFINDLRISRINGVCTISTSSLPTDYLRHNLPDGKIIMANFQCYILGKFSSEKISQAIGLELGLSNLHLKRLNSLGVKKNNEEKFQEFMMVKYKQVKIYKNKLNHLEELVYGSSADDHALINYYLKAKDKSLFEVLTFLSQKKHIGDLNLAEDLERKGFTNLSKKIRG